jgi:hypothetical protein
MVQVPATELHTEETESERVTRWRAERLERAGYATEVARELAERVDIDLHHAIQLVERGCSPEMAARILR